MSAPWPRWRASHWNTFLLSIILTFVAVVLAAFTGLVLNGERAIREGHLMRGRALFGSIVLTRKWNALHGGVFVEKAPGMLSNPWLENPDRHGDDGTVYTKKNPALMTREISEIAEREGGFRFHITSLKPLNPANVADPFEREALASFERGATEASTRTENDGKPWYRYMAPLLVEKPCLGCHAKQGYRIGDVRGGISVSFGTVEAESAIHRARWAGVGFALLTAALLILLVWRMVSGLHGRVVAAESRIRVMALTDELTGLANRRQAGELLLQEVARSARYGRPVSLILFDIDHFKKVNDTYGHEAGDAVLRSVARTAAGALRKTDLGGRWGGEEFLAILPETDAAGARVLAERLRAALDGLRTPYAGRELHVTVSSGISTWAPAAPSTAAVEIDVLLRQADEALYRAKDAGRNQVSG